MADLDLWLAVAHHVLIFGIFGVISAELVLVRPGIDSATVARLARIDLWYGILAGAILIVGFTRANLAAKGWDYYAHNAFFWSKIGTFAVIGLLSVPPTIAYIRWRRGNIVPSDEQVTRVRFFLRAQVALFALLLVFAAAMARGYGQ